MFIWKVSTIPQAHASQRHQEPGRDCERSLLGQLEQDAGRGRRMQKRDAAPGGAGAWRFVDQTVACTTAGGECAVEIGYAITDVMNPGAAAGEKARDGAVGVVWVAQRDVHVAQGQADNRRAVAR